MRCGSLFVVGLEPQLDDPSVEPHADERPAAMVEVTELIGAVGVQAVAMRVVATLDASRRLACWRDGAEGSASGAGHSCTSFYPCWPSTIQPRPLDQGNVIQLGDGADSEYWSLPHDGEAERLYPNVDGFHQGPCGVLNFDPRGDSQEPKSSRRCWTRLTEILL